MMRCALVLLLTLHLGLLSAADALGSPLVGAEDDWLPFSGVVGQQATGLAVDVVSAAFAASGIKPRFSPLPYARCLAKVRNGELVGCFDAVRTSVREKDYLWPDYPLFRARINYYVRKQDKRTKLQLADLAGQRVGVTNNYEYGEQFDTDNRIVRDVSNTDILLIKKLLAGHIDTIVLYEKVANHLIAAYPELKDKMRTVGFVALVPLYMVISRKRADAPAILQQFNRGMKLIIDNGQYNKILNKWQE